MGSLIGWGIGFVSVILGALVLIFLAGLASAAWEIRGEKRAGKVPTRPAWENAQKRRALGGFRAQIRVAWSSARHRASGRTCWCGRGPVVEFPPSDLGEPAGLGCAAWESGDFHAITLHDAAGGYSRTPVAS